MYTINELARMTGLTARTLRNYLRMGILEGEKETGVWEFSEEQVEAFLQHPTVKPSLEAKRRAIVFDFLAEDRKQENAACVLLDLRADPEEAEEISQFFCNAIEAARGIRFSYQYENGMVRIHLSGPEDCVQDMMRAYYTT